MQLQKNGLIEQNEPLVGAINSLNRRDLIKRVGFASAIALPLISSVVAPSAINAMSCTGPGTLPMGTVIQTCRGAAQCTAEAALFCCSGTATHTVIVCGAPGWGPCVCN